MYKEAFDEFHANVVALVDGFDAWVAAGKPLSDAEAKMYRCMKAAVKRYEADRAAKLVGRNE